MAHDSLRSKLSDFYKNFAKYESNDTEILEFLTQWLKEHILVTDRKYVDLFIAKKPELTKAE